MMSTKQKILAFISAVVFGAVIIGSLSFIASASEHDCAGEDCAVCELIQQCEKLLTCCGSGVKLCVSHFEVLFAMTAVLLCGRAVFGKTTLISLKVELLN